MKTRSTLFIGAMIFLIVGFLFVIFDSKAIHDENSNFNKYYPTSFSENEKKYIESISVSSAFSFFLMGIGMTLLAIGLFAIIEERDKNGNNKRNIHN